jgi:hypothetical protein
MTASSRSLCHQTTRAMILMIELQQMYIHSLITIREDLESITSILYQVFEIPSFKRNYDAAFGFV